MQTLKEQLQKLISSFYTVLLKGLIDIFNGAVISAAKELSLGVWDIMHFIF